MHDIDTRANMKRCPVTKVTNDEVGPYEVECDIFKAVVKYEQLYGQQSGIYTTNEFLTY